MKLKYILVLSILLLAFVIPVHADTMLAYPKNSNALWNQSGNFYETDWYSEHGYVPDQYVWACIALGAAFTIVSLVSPRRVIPSLIAPIFWAWSTWYSIYMYQYTISSTGQTTNIGGSLTQSNASVILVQVVQSMGSLQIALLGVTVLTVIYAAYVLFFEKNETKSSGPIKPPE
jgi:glucan phosphoethanolaminetransferase (alkaline phosphatase superfamily)